MLVDYDTSADNINSKQSEDRGAHGVERTDEGSLLLVPFLVTTALNTH